MKSPFATTTEIESIGKRSRDSDRQIKQIFKLGGSKAFNRRRTQACGEPEAIA